LPERASSDCKRARPLNTAAAPAIDHTPAPAPIDVLELRAWARGYLWWAGLIDTIPAAVNPLAEFAERAGIDPDAAQKILAAAFAPFREGEL
jgi:hypothetical protein